MLKLIQILLLNIVEVAFNIKPARKDPEPYHMSILSGHQWVLELIAGHPNHIHCELGVQKETFLQLLIELCQAGHCDLRRVTLEEQLAIFLYTCVMGLTVQSCWRAFPVFKQYDLSVFLHTEYPQNIHLIDFLVGTSER